MQIYDPWWSGISANRDGSEELVLYWDRNGFCIWSKRLEKHRFPWPKTKGAARRMHMEELLYLIDGIDPTTIDPLDALSCERVG